MKTQITLRLSEAGYPFPCFEGELLNWDAGSYITYDEQQRDYPKARYVLAAMREHRPEQYARERALAIKHSLTETVFAPGAQAYVKLFDDVN